MRDDDPRLKLFLDHRATLVDYTTPIVGDRVRTEDYGLCDPQTRHSRR